MNLSARSSPETLRAPTISRKVELVLSPAKFTWNVLSMSSAHCTLKFGVYGFGFWP